MDLTYRPLDYDEPTWGADTWPFLIAVGAGDEATVRHMLGADPSLARCEYAYLEPLHFAVGANRIEMVQLLLEAGADPLADGWGYSKLACWGEDTPVARARDRELDAIVRLLEASTKPRALVQSQPPSPPPAGQRLMEDEMSLTCHRGDIEDARDLLRHHPELAQAGLYEAVHQGHHELVALLIENGADAAKPWRWACWYTPLMHALRYPSPRYETAELLLDHGVGANDTNGLGMTALHILAREGTVEAAGWLLDRGASIDRRDGQYASTPLAWAARAGREETVRFLLSRGAQPVLPDDEPWSTAAAWARRRGLSHILTLLLS